MGPLAAVGFHMLDVPCIPKTKITPIVAFYLSLSPSACTMLVLY